MANDEININKHSLQKMSEIEQKIQTLLEEHRKDLMNFALKYIAEDVFSDIMGAPALLIYYSMAHHALLQKQDEFAYWPDFINNCLKKIESEVEKKETA